jgi:hypothetical protein
MNDATSRTPTLLPGLAGRALLAGLVLMLACAAAQAATGAAVRPVLAPHQLWTSHGLAAPVLAIVVFLCARWLPIAGIIVVGAVWYAVAVIGAPVAPDGLAQFGPRYAFHVQAAALLMPLAALAGLGLSRSASRARLAEHGLGWMLPASRG